jgi:hypothetical protein
LEMLVGEDAASGAVVSRERRVAEADEKGLAQLDADGYRPAATRRRLRGLHVRSRGPEERESVHLLYDKAGLARCLECAGHRLGPRCRRLKIEDRRADLCSGLAL